MVVFCRVFRVIIEKMGNMSCFSKTSFLVLFLKVLLQTGPKSLHVYLKRCCKEVVFVFLNWIVAVAFWPKIWIIGYVSSIFQVNNRIDIIQGYRM